MDQINKQIITKTCLYNFEPLKPHFYIVKLGFTVVFIIFLIFAQKHRLWVLVLTSTHNLCFEQKDEKYRYFFYLKKIQFLVVKFSVYLNRHVFIMTKFSLYVFHRSLTVTRFCVCALLLFIND